MGDLSAHFSRSEFRCHHCGHLVGPDHALIASLERLRALVGRPVRIVSGTRCRAHNAAVGGARSSRHLVGDAADIEAELRVTVAVAKAAGFRGIGYRRRDGLVVHVDMRPSPVYFIDG